MDQRKAAAAWLFEAERELRQAQAGLTRDGPGARERYARARLEADRAAALAVRLLALGVRAAW
jgi:hypothetical protein